MSIITDGAPEAPLTGILNMGESVIDQEPLKEAQPGTEDKTSEQETNTQETENNSEEFISGTKKARMLGESRRKLANTLIESAKVSSSAAQTLKLAANSDPDLAKYLQKHWAKDYAEIVEGRTNYEDENPAVDLESAKVQARADLLSEQIKEQKKDQAQDFAERLSFTVDEATQLEDLASKLEGMNIGGVALDYEMALKKAAFAIREDKAKAGVIGLPKGNPAQQADTINRDIEMESLAAVGNRLTGRKKSEIVGGLKLVNDNLKGNVFRIPMGE